MTKKLYVGNLPFQTTEEDLSDIFSQAGNVESVRIINVKGKNKSFRQRLGRRSDWKKAYVRVREGQVIDHLGSESA